MHEFEARLTGKVHGVGFRNFVQSKARALWLTGTVQNMSDRSVRVIAQGPEEKLHVFVDHLHKGPFLARVGNVTVNWREPTETCKDFTIVY